ncbi:MAG: ABC transporter ATP-binding protein [Fibrobacteres bacterium]|nr:ABC transporter ATP-binding protein [Fibrobacterota bacterium]
MNTIMEVANLSKSFGGIKAVRDVSFSVNTGTIHAVIGPNGAGKSTLFNLLAGATPADTGRINFNGKDITGFPTHKIAALKIARTFQNLKIAPKMSVLDNIRLGLHTVCKTGLIASLLRTPSVRREERETYEKAEAAAKRLDIHHLLDREAGTLAYGEQRSVEMARALISDPLLLLLDEPAAGLNSRETEDLADRIKGINETGITVLLVEHDMGLVMRISDHVTVLAQGAKLASGTPREVQDNKEVVRIYLGDDE